MSKKKYIAPMTTSLRLDAGQEMLAASEQGPYAGAKPNHEWNDDIYDDDGADQWGLSPYDDDGR